MSRNAQRIAHFIALTFVLSWGLAGLYYAFGGRLDGPYGFAVVTVYMFCPLIATVLLQKFVYGEPLKKPLGISFKINQWFFVALLLPIIFAIGTFFVSLVLPGISLSVNMAGMFERFKDFLTPEQIEFMRGSFASAPIHPFFITLFQALLAGLTINALYAFGEELGWRGFLMKQLEGVNFWKQAGFIGLVWGVWHAPIILQGHNYAQHPFIGVFLMIVWCILLTPVMMVIRMKARSVIAASIMHGTINASYGLSIMLVQGGNDLTTGLLGLPGFIMLILINFFFVTYEKKQIEKERAAVTPIATVSN